MGFRLRRAGVVLVAAVLLNAGPTFAKPVESQENSTYSRLQHLVLEVKAKSVRALAATSEAAARAVDEGKDTIAEVETDFAPYLQTFRNVLNERKARLANIGTDAVARFEAWKETVTKAWDEKWSDIWAQSWAEIQRSAIETLDRFRDWIAKQSAPDEHAETPV
jgi:hypothetical protein